MAEQIVVKNCPESLKNRLQEYWEKKSGRVRKQMGPFPEEQRHLCLTMERFGSGFEGALVLKLPSGTVTAKATAEDGFVVVDRLVDKFVREIKKHKGKLRHEDIYRRKQRRERLREVVPLLEAEAERKDKETFFALLRPLLRDLEETARHEITIAQLQDAIPPGELDISDVVDEVLVRAWEQFAQRPAEQPLEGWLMQLLHQVLDEEIQNRVSELSEYEEQASTDSRYPVDEDWAAENAPGWEEPAGISVEDLLPGEEAPEPWHMIEAEDQMRWLLAQLSMLPAVRRRAFTLQAIDGWEVEEIAMLQRRSAQEVREDIRKVREFLLERLKAFRRREEP